MPRKSFRYGYVTSLIDRCTCELTSSAFRILHHICDQSFVVAERDCDEISPERLAAGTENVFGRIDDMSKRTIHYGLRSLETLGLIQIHGVGGQVRKYVLDIDVLEDRQPARFGKVKRSLIFGQTFAEAQKSEKSGCNWLHPNATKSGRAPRRTYTRIMRIGATRERAGLISISNISNVRASLNSKELSSVSATLTPPLVFRENPMKISGGKFAGAVLVVAQNASRGTSVAQEKRIAAGKLDALYSRYTSLTREKYNFTPPPMTAVNLAIFRRVFVSVPEIDTVELMNLVIENWTAIITGRFSWMKDPPEYPDLLFICRNLQKFVDATLAIQRGEPLRIVQRRLQRIAERAVNRDDDKDAKIKSLEGEIEYLRTNQLVNGMQMPVLRQGLRRVVPVVLPPEEGQPEHDD